MDSEWKMLLNSARRTCLGAPGCLRWNSAVSSGAKTSEADSQELCSRPYPFHLMRYWNRLQYQRLSSISSTSHSASPSMTMGGGWSSILRPVIGLSGAGVSFTTLNTGWSCFIRYGVTPYKCLGKISDILHLNNKNNQLERRVQPPKDIH